MFKEQQSKLRDVLERDIVSVHWACSEPRLLVLEAESEGAINPSIGGIHTKVSTNHIHLILDSGSQYGTGACIKLCHAVASVVQD